MTEVNFRSQMLKDPCESFVIECTPCKPMYMPFDEPKGNLGLNSLPPESFLDPHINPSPVQIQDKVHTLESLGCSTPCPTLHHQTTLSTYRPNVSSNQQKDQVYEGMVGVSICQTDAFFEDRSTFPEASIVSIQEPKLFGSRNDHPPHSPYYAHGNTQHSENPDFTVLTQGPPVSQPPKPNYAQPEVLLCTPPAECMPYRQPTNDDTDIYGIYGSLARETFNQDTLQPGSAMTDTTSTIISPVLALEKLHLYTKPSIEKNEEAHVVPVPTCMPVSPGQGDLMPVSNLTGRRKALLIGINYFGKPYELKGCINDVQHIKEFLMESYGFPAEGMVIMTDDQSNNPHRMPTRQNILDAMKWLTDGARPNDSLFFHFSGHGSQTPDLDGDEDDGYDETICPCDFDKEGMIVDDDMNSILVQPLPAGCRLTALFDCCHSGTALDLPYVYNSQGELKSFHPAQAVVSTLCDLSAKTQMGDLVGALMTLKTGMWNVVNGKTIESNNQREKGGLADVIMFSSCKDCQTSSDAMLENMGNTGAMSLALIAALRSNPHNQTYLDLLNSVRQALLGGEFSQIPQLSTARPMDMNSIFHM